MLCGFDTNVLVHANLPVLAESETVRANLRSKLGDDNWQIALTAVVLHEFVHVITDQRRFNPPVPMASALALAKGYLARPKVVFRSMVVRCSWPCTCWNVTALAASESRAHCWRLLFCGTE